MSDAVEIALIEKQIGRVEVVDSGQSEKMIKLRSSMLKRLNARR
jgi:hypothetical protein